MIGNGGHAGEKLDDAGRVAQRNGALQLVSRSPKPIPVMTRVRSRAQPSC